jgi:hypothetical protein
MFVIIFIPNVPKSYKLRLESAETIVLDYKTLAFTITSLCYKHFNLTSTGMHQDSINYNLKAAGFRK